VCVYETCARAYMSARTQVQPDSSVTPGGAYAKYICTRTVLTTTLSTQYPASALSRQFTAMLHTSTTHEGDNQETRDTQQSSLMYRVCKKRPTLKPTTGRPRQQQEVA